jgi:hypothetical protein
VQAPPVGFWTWTAGTQVRVFVVERDFKPEEIASLLAPLKNWNAVSEATGSRVKFEYSGTRASPQYCENCLTLSRGAVFQTRERHLTELRAYSVRNDRIITWATIVVDFSLTNHKALTDAVAHELGHSFGLRDCYTCKAKSTVMNQFGPVNVANEVPGPTACDVAQVKSTYTQLALQASRTAQSKKVAWDEGEEPVDDDTPIVETKPLVFSKPIVISKPLVIPKPLVDPKPLVISKPPVVAKPLVVPKP